MHEFFIAHKLDLTRAVIGFFTWFFIVVGWLVVNKQNNNREFRKELRNSLNNLIEEVRDISSFGVEYWSGNKDKNLEAKIMLSIKVLNRGVDRLPLSLNEKSSVRFYLLKFKQSITDNPGFGSSRKIVGVDEEQTYYQPVIALIVNSGENLIDDLERAFSYKCSFL